MTPCGTLTFYCGKMAAGKSTKSQAFAQEHNAVLVSEDEWLNALYPEQIKNVQDYLKFSALLKPLLQKHVQNILQSGSSVVMDFPANTRDQRQWFLQIAQSAGAPHHMFYLDISDEQCLQQLAQRRTQQPERAKFDTPETFQLISGFFETPDRHEALNIEVLRG
ncbi:MAG: AAA family ATPase [Granulosicoccaceae bacterium]